MMTLKNIPKHCLHDTDLFCIYGIIILYYCVVNRHLPLVYVYNI